MWYHRLAEVCRIENGGLIWQQYEKKNGSFEIKVSCGYDVNGRQVNQYRSYYPEPGMTKKQIEKEVNRQAVLFEEDCKRGQITAAVKFQTLCEQWFDEYAKLNLRPTSIQRLRGATVRVYPALGHKRMDKITARDIQKFITDLVTNGKNMRTGKPLSKKTAVHHLRCTAATGAASCWAWNGRTSTLKTS